MIDSLGGALPIAKERCAQEPIHIPGTIQPHGILFVLAASTFTVMNVSANVEAMLGIPVGRVCGARLSTVLGTSQCERLEAAIRRGDPAAIMNPMRFHFVIGGARVDVECVVHWSDGAVIVEFEPFQPPLHCNEYDPSSPVRIPIARMEAAPDIVTLAQCAADDVRLLTGFDRVMVYRFDAEWHGDVIAESRSGSAPVTYLGLRFPAGDIPEQARRLYLKNPLRLLADVDYVPAPLVPRCDPATGRPVDLSRAILRSVSPVHLEYLQNMGVKATLTISIVVGGQLWGLIACHHLQPRRLDYVTRASCEFFGQMLGWQVGMRFEAERLKYTIWANGLIDRYDRSLSAHDDLAQGVVASAPELLDLFAAQGLVVRLDGVFRRFGATPSDDGLVARIADGLHRGAANGVAASHQVGTLVPEAGVASVKASGALLIMLSERGDEFLLCFRAEVIESVHWGGDVRTPVTESAGKLHPRTSFALWQQNVRGQSSRWSANDIADAHALRERILERSHTIARRRAEERIRFLAHHDALTCLPNRASFHETLRRSIEEAKQERAMLAVLFIDLDHFKLFNDKFGHATGDQILQAAALRMKACVRHGDVVSRLGGDEFVIISSHLGKESDADSIAGKVLAAIAEPFIVGDSIGGDQVERNEIRFTASVGIAVYPRDSIDADALLQHADLAMYRAKERGRNSFQHFDVGDAGPTYERLALERRIEDGLARAEFVPYYQPIVALASGDLVSVEALARWIHPEHGVLAPSRFIAVAEESRLIVTLGEAMLRAACANCAHWRATAGSERLRVSVNVSARQFRDAGFLDTVREIVAETGLTPEALQLELTESMLIENEEYAIRTLRALANAGITIVIDDFGTGYSSLSYLKRLPVDVLKIDQSFVRDLTALPDDSAIVRAIIAMAHSLKLSVVAEGVETHAQLDLLRTLGCDSIQGYLIARPLSLNAATAFIGRFDLERIIAASPAA